MSASKSFWIPLESNPDVINKYIKSLGVPEKFHTVDVLGLDEDLLKMIPRPVFALMLLYPTSEKVESAVKQEVEKLTKEGYQPPKDVYFVKQHIGNACGTIALIHSLGNNVAAMKLEGGPFKEFYEKTKSLPPDQICQELEKDKNFAAAHEESAKEGQTAAPAADEKVDYHFITFVNVGGKLYELDGAKPFPIGHGHTDGEKFLEDAAKVCQKFIQRDPSNLRFTIIALVGA